MKKEAVFHMNTEEYVYPVSRDALVFRIRTAKCDIDECVLVHWDRTEPKAKNEIRLHSLICDELFEYWEATVRFDDVARYRKYYFKLTDYEGTDFFVNANGVCEDIPDDGFFEYLYANGTDVITVPEWSKGCVYYQIFPERFCNGDHRLDPLGTMPWGTAPTRDNFMGGDLAGIISKIEYLSRLGVDCIYLNPIFEADFNHKYATTDYYKIDPQFGTNSLFGSFVRKCHAKGIRVILDGVFNHTGVHFAPFDDVKISGEKSKYASWYHIKKYPIEYSSEFYECVGDYPWMPKLNTANPDVRKFIIDVMEYWIRNYDIDGWRLDVADEVDPSVWEEARIVLKQKYPDRILIGETWGYGGRLLRGNQMDVVMNYMFRDAVWDYFGRDKITAEVFAGRIGHVLALHRVITSQCMFNLIDSHDTERFKFIAGDSDDRLKLAAAFQMAFIGAPCVYYGDELGMTGDNDPDDRRCMEWNIAEDNEMFKFYGQLIALRHESRAVKMGDFRFVEADSEKDLIVFQRRYEEEKVYVLLHKGSGTVQTLIEDENISIGPCSVQIVRKYVPKAQK